MLKRYKNKWDEHEFSTGSYAGKDYLEFQKDCRSDLKKMAKENDMELVSFNKNHYCFSAVLKDDEDRYVYVSQSDVRFFMKDEVLVRSMEHEKDWSGGRNTFCTWGEVGERAKAIAQGYY